MFIEYQSMWQWQIVYYRDKCDKNINMDTYTLNTPSPSWAYLSLLAKLLNLLREWDAWEKDGDNPSMANKSKTGVIHQINIGYYWVKQI